IGYLTIDASPWASVRVRGKPVGDTPLYKVPVDEGDVVVVLENPDTKKTVSKKVRVVRGKTTSMKVNLQ
ncbi:MAG: PEGA domain-containing protein, partial [Myxococcaceae bacterium]|nr:PEGA domain-containing protein [Myxococcaceae bacterium]